MLLKYQMKLNLKQIKVKEIVSVAYDRTRQILKDHEKDIRKLANKLLETETLLLDDIEKLIDPKLRDSISNENLMFSTPNNIDNESNKESIMKDVDNQQKKAK